MKFFFYVAAMAGAAIGMFATPLAGTHAVFAQFGARDSLPASQQAAPLPKPAAGEAQAARASM